MTPRYIKTDTADGFLEVISDLGDGNDFEKTHDSIAELAQIVKRFIIDEKFTITPSIRNCAFEPVHEA